ncbi:MAG: FeoB small GTPase domain-containing protein, partial [Ruthenibacterium lactatiformans]
MGLTNRSTGAHAADGMLAVVKRRETDSVVALAGNPNVGKSTVFNELTGMNQHTGNWPGKTVASAQGYCETGGWGCVLVDIPGCYSLMAHSAEEAVARDFICFGGANAVVVVCDASCLERNLNLALQAMEITDNVVLCVNLMDEARRKGVEVDAALLGQRLGVPVVPAAARSGEGLPELMCAVERVARGECAGHVCRVRYAQPVEAALALLTPAVANAAGTGGPAPRWLALRLLEGDTELNAGIVRYLGFSLAQHPDVAEILARARRLLAEGGVTQEALHDEVVRSLVRTAETVCIGAVRHTPTPQELRDRKLDRILTSRRTGFPLMLLLLLGVFWLTITGANVPSQLLADGLFWVGDRLGGAMAWAGAPVWVKGLLVDGVYRVLAWVVSVMLPPMAIFFPLFTLLEDLGYLPRVAFNLDRTFKKCRACGKQALTMAMGFGCNAAGVVGCRIID